MGREKVKEKEAGVVLQYGTFDVGNYGDLLFPIVARFELEKRNIGTIPVSPTHRSTSYQDAIKPISIVEAKSHEECKAIIIGGGNIIH